MDDTLLKKKERLIERLGVHLEQKDQIAPVAARLLSSLILSGNRGCTFDDLVESLQASKSTVSTHLNTLQTQQKITYYTVCGDRKKYFILNPNATLLKVDEMLRNWEEERQLHLEVTCFKKLVNESLPEGEQPQFDLVYHTEYLTFLDQASETIQRLREKLIEQSKNN